MTLSKQESKELRRETSLLGQLNNTSDIYDNYMPQMISEQQALQEGLSIITSLTDLNFHHTNQIYIKPELWEEDEFN